MIPDGWKIELLGEFMIVKDGVHQTPTYIESGIPFLRVTDIQDESINLSKTKYISKEEYDKITARLKPTSGDILYSKNGTIGITRIVDWDWEFSFFVSLALLRFKKDGYSVQYLAQYLQSDLAKREIYQGSKQGSVINLHLEEIQKFRVPIPPFLEQCRIAEVLGVWDESIDLLERLIGRVRSRKQGLMQQLLTGKKRFKEFEGSEWKTKKLKDIGKVASGGTPDTNNPEYWNGNIPWCTPSEITALKDRYINFTGRTVSNEGIKSSSTAIIPVNSLLVCTRATIGYSAINTVPMCTNQGFKNIIPNKLISVEFLYYKLCLEKHQLLRLASGSTFLEISKKDFEIIEISIPSLPEQEKIAAVLSAADEEISTLEKQLAAYKQQKLGLMQQLLTGKIRVGMI